MAIDQLTADCLAEACKFRPATGPRPVPGQRQWVDAGIPGDSRSHRRRETQREQAQRERRQQRSVERTVEEAASRNARSQPVLQHLVDELRRTEPTPERTYEVRGVAIEEGDANVHHVLLCTDRRVVYSRAVTSRGVEVLAVYPHGALDVRGTTFQRHPELHAGPPAVLEWPRGAGEEGVLDLGVRQVMSGPSPYLEELMRTVASRPPQIRLQATPQPTVPVAPASPRAWHPDPTGRHGQRWWDGTRWTEHVADGGVTGTDPI